jgi:lipid-binding SYLF domain-containing protein
VGFQAGVSSTDVVLVFRTQRGVDSIVNGKFTIGADAAAAAGPVGRNASASTDGHLKAEIYSYSRSRGLFAGVTPRRIFEGGVGNVPGAVVNFRDALEEYTSK